MAEELRDSAHNEIRLLTESHSELKNRYKELAVSLKLSKEEIYSLQSRSDELEKENALFKQLAHAVEGAISELRERLDGPPLRTDPDKKKPSYEANMEMLEAHDLWADTVGRIKKYDFVSLFEKDLPLLLEHKQSYERSLADQAVAAGERDKAKERRNNITKIVFTLLGVAGLNAGSILWRGTLGSEFAGLDVRIAKIEDSLNDNPVAYLSSLESIRSEFQEDIDALKEFRVRNEEKLDALKVTVEIPE